jgi:hypothetical protein
MNGRQFSTLGGLLFGYDQGVVSGILTMESFGARFPRVYADSNFKGWFVSTLLLGMLSPFALCPRILLIYGPAAWLGSLVNGPIGDRFGRKRSMNLAVVIFVIGSAIQFSKRLCREEYQGSGTNLLSRQSHCWFRHRAVDADRALVYLGGSCLGCMNGSCCSNVPGIDLHSTDSRRTGCPSAT